MISLNFTSNTKGLDSLKKQLFQKVAVKVGVLGADNARGDGGLTNAEIGARHEFGVISEHLPRRSFLWDMILLKKNELTKTAGKILKKDIESQAPIENSFKKIGLAAESIVIKAFDSDGYGTWQPLSQRRVQEKAEQNLAPGILMATTQLSKSINSKVVVGNDS